MIAVNDVSELPPITTEERAKYRAVLAAAVEYILDETDDDADGPDAGERLSESYEPFDGDDEPCDDELTHAGLSPQEKRVFLAVWRMLRDVNPDGSDHSDAERSAASFEVEHAVLAMGPECSCGGHQSGDHECPEGT